MKVEIQPGKPVQFDQSRFSSNQGGTYDLDALELSEEDQKRIAALPGVKPAGAPSRKSAAASGAVTPSAEG
jgi:hypothetical protein